MVNGLYHMTIVHWYTETPKYWLLCGHGHQWSLAMPSLGEIEHQCEHWPAPTTKNNAFIFYFKNRWSYLLQK